MEYDLTSGRKVHALRADYDTEYEQHSPGAYLEYHIIEQLFRAGYEEYCSGPGLNEYKLKWTDKTRESVGLTVCNRTPAGALLLIVETLLSYRRKLRSLMERKVNGA